MGPDVIDLVLHHLLKAQDVTRRHYNHSRLAPMVRQACQAWGDYVWENHGPGHECEQRCDAKGLVLA